MQQQPGRSSRLTTFLVIYLVMYGGFLLYLHFLAPKPPPAPEQLAASHEAAQRLEKEGRTEAPDVAVADRVKKLERAIRGYEEYYQADKASGSGKPSPKALQARFQAINIYDYLANLEGRRAGTHWFDQAEAKLKELEKEFHGRQGEVTVEVRGEIRRETGDLAQAASRRLNEIRAARDEVNRPKWDYRILDLLVQIFGGRQQPAFSYFMALAFLVLVLKGLTFPFQKKQYQYQQDMMRVQPLVKEAQEKLKGRPPEEVNKRIFQIYKENNVNIASGCLPMLVLMFVLFPVYYMIRNYEYQFTYGSFLWIGSEVSRSAWWLGDNLAQFDVPLFITYLVSTVAYSLMQPKPADPQQAQQQRMMLILMPVMFGWFMWIYQWSSAFMLYWLLLNLVSMYQSWILIRQFRLVPQPAAAAAGEGEGRTGPAAQPLPPMQGRRAGENGRSHRAPQGNQRVRPRGPGGGRRRRRSGTE